MSKLQESDRQRYNQVLSEARKAYEKLIPLDQWQFEKEVENSTKIYVRQDSLTGIKMARGDTTISKPSLEVIAALHDSRILADYDNTVAEFMTLAEWPDFQLTRVLSKKTPFIAQRETVVIGQTINLDNGSTLLIGKSIEDPLCLDKNLFVRAHLYLLTWLVTPDAKDPNLTHIQYIIHIDIKGWIPVSLFNTVIKEQALTPHKFKTYIEKN